jgi:NAD(P)-dependent dehydrogenase (short-subunit alcohol dehydrogenase family)
MHHGLVTFGDTAQLAYDRMIDLVTQAENHLARHNAWTISQPAVTPPAKSLRREIAQLRRDVSAAAGAPMILQTHREHIAFAQRPDLPALTQQGLATPDHAIRTKPFPMLGRDLAAFRAAYERYFAAHATGHVTMLDAAPRIILDPELGLCAVGRTANAAVIAGDIYRHTIDIILRATALGGWQALSADHIFDMEYWPLQLAKLRPTTLPFTGEVALVTGAASGIGKACVESMLKRGAAVVGLDINPAITALHDRPDFAGIVCDLTDEQQIIAAVEQAVLKFGGLDMLVLNAGIFPKACNIADMPLAHWRKVLTLNLDANLLLMRECHPLLKLAPNTGRVAIIGSKNVLAPGPGAAAYSASKAAVNQLARVAALEWGPDKIRINSLHPNAVFDTALWPPEVLASRAKSYGLTVEQYKLNNVMKVEVTSHDVAELAAEMCGPLFAKTTASQVPVDGGNDRVI